MGDGEAKDAEEDEEDVLAGDCRVRAGAGWSLGKGDCVDIGGGAEDVEGVAGAMEEEDRVVEGARDAGVDCYARRGIRGGRVVIGTDGFHGRLIEIDR